MSCIKKPICFCHFILFSHTFIFGAQFTEILLNSLLFIGWFLVLSVENIEMCVISESLLKMCSGSKYDTLKG